MIEEQARYRSRLAVRFIASLMLLGALGLAIAGVLDRNAGAYAQAALGRAMVTFAVARTLNGVISVVQETEVAVQPAGVGMALMPGQFLDPLNDLIERFSWVMLASATALGIQSSLLHMSAWWVMDALVCLAVAALLARLWWRGRNGPLEVLLQRVAVIVLFVRFVIPLLLLLVSLVSATFLQGEQDRATEQLLDAAEEVSTLAREVEAQATPADVEQGLLERFGDYLSDRLAELDAAERIRQARTALAGAADQVVTLTASFLLETIVLPLLLLWIAWQLLRWLLRPLPS